MQSTDNGSFFSEQSQGRLTLDAEKWEDTGKRRSGEAVGRQRAGGKCWVGVDQKGENTGVY